MPRPTLPVEERKKLRAARNASYYQRKKDDTIKYQGKAVVYVISGLPDDKCYVGVSNNFTKRSTVHERTHGDVTITPMLIFNEPIETYRLNRYESLIMRHVGIEKCINQVNLPLSVDSGEKQVVMEHIHLLNDESRDLVLRILEKGGETPIAS